MLTDEMIGRDSEVLKDVRNELCTTLRVPMWSVKQGHVIRKWASSLPLLHYCKIIELAP